MTLQAIDKPQAHRLGIKNDGLVGWTTALTLDGKPLLGVQSLTLRIHADDVTRVTLEFDAEVDADVLALIA